MTGLLGMNPYPGLLQPQDLRYAQTQGLLGAGAGLLGASGWSPTPISTGQALGAGLQQGLGAYNQAANQAMQGKLMQQQLNQPGKVVVKDVRVGVDDQGRPLLRSGAFDAEGNLRHWLGDPTPTTPGVTVQNINERAPPGFQYDPSDPRRLMPIPGGPKDPQMEIQQKRTENWMAENKDFLEEGRKALAEIPRYERMLNLLDSVDTGTFAESKLRFKKGLEGLGFDVDMENIANSEQLLSMLGGQVMAQVQLTKGAVSDREMAFFERISANFGNTPEGNRRILQFHLAMKKRNAELAKMVRKARRDGRSPQAINKMVWDYVEANPLDQGGDPGMAAPAPTNAPAQSDIDSLIKQYTTPGGQ